MKHVILFFCLLLLCFGQPVYAQRSDCYRTLIDEGVSAFDSGDFNLAQTRFEATLECRRQGTKAEREETDLLIQTAAKLAAAKATCSCSLRNAGNPSNKNRGDELNRIGVCMDGIKSYDLALKWFLKAESLDNSYGIVNVAQYYRLGKTGAFNLPEAIRLLNRVLQLNADKTIVGQAHGELAAIYYNGGEGVPQGYRLALDQCERGMVLNDPVSFVLAGSIYFHGLGTAKDYQKAKAYSEKGAEFGYRFSMNILGAIYYNGHGVTIRKKVARGWWEEAAALGDQDAQNKLNTLSFE